MTRTLIRSNINFSLHAGISIEKCHETLRKIYGPDCPSLKTVRHWYCRFADGESSLEDLPRKGRPQIPDLDRKIFEILQEVPHASTKFLAETLHVDRSTIKNRLVETLQYVKVSVRWVPHLLTEAQKLKRIQLGSMLKGLLQQEQ